MTDPMTPGLTERLASVITATLTEVERADLGHTLRRTLDTTVPSSDDLDDALRGRFNDLVGLLITGTCPTVVEGSDPGT